MKKKKLKVGLFAITGCQGCLLSVIFNEDQILSMLSLIDIQAFPFIKNKNAEGRFDVVFLEGVVCSNDDLNTLKKLRKNTKTLIALGACSGTGCIPSYKNFTPSENYKELKYKKDKLIQDIKPTPIDTYVRVDHYIPGCPPDKHEILTAIKDLVVGKKPTNYTHPVCVECKLNSNYCLLENNKLCLGPITVGGCNSICINSNYECWGCRGPTDDANIKEHVLLLKEKGHKIDHIKKRIQTFAGMKIKELKKKKMWLE